MDELDRGAPARAAEADERQVVEVAERAEDRE
jgi:hypothetical protein